MVTFEKSKPFRESECPVIATESAVYCRSSLSSMPAHPESLRRWALDSENGLIEIDAGKPATGLVLWGEGQHGRFFCLINIDGSRLISAMRYLQEARLGGVAAFQSNLTKAVNALSNISPTQKAEFGRD
jgi:hypothetical protein